MSYSLNFKVRLAIAKMLKKSCKYLAVCSGRQRSWTVSVVIPCRCGLTWEGGEVFQSISYRHYVKPLHQDGEPARNSVQFARKTDSLPFHYRSPKPPNWRQWEMCPQQTCWELQVCPLLLCKNLNLPQPPPLWNLGGEEGVKTVNILVLDSSK